jgi:predicted unusual protein kinase regulating ubiquinone biosynthesis (AarF/ABC1/UbiB family)
MIVSFLFWDIFLPKIRLGALASANRSRRLKRSAEKFRMLAIDLGGVMIKVGQFLSTRVDVLPLEIVEELSGLQDEVPPVPFMEIKQFAEIELGASLDHYYDNFNAVPLASASLGQVHTACLNQSYQNNSTFSEVVVKIQRPDIEFLIKTDLAAITKVGGWLYRYHPIRKRANIPELIKEFSKVLYEEIDYISEGNNAETFAQNFINDPGIRVPKVVWSLTRKRVLTLENVLGIKITDYKRIEDAGISLAEVANRVFDTYLKQIFEDGFFHADPHPGNLFVSPLNNGQNDTNPWLLTFVDFGMKGTIEPNLKTGLKELIIGIGLRDSKRVVNSYMILGVLLPSADLKMIEDASSKIFEQFWGKNMKELQTTSPDDLMEFLSEYRDLLYSLPFQIPTNIIFLGRTIGILSGICTGLNPEFNAWDHMVPFAQKLVASEASIIPKTIINEVQKNLSVLFSLPVKIDKAIDSLTQGEIEFKIYHLDIHHIKLRRMIASITSAIIFSASLIGAIILLINELRTLSTVFFILAAVLIIYTLYLTKKFL